MVVGLSGGASGGTPTVPGGGGIPTRPDSPRRSELLAALSLAIDLGLGQPMEHMMRATLLGLRIAAVLGADRAAAERIYYANLLAWIGCHADSYELANLFGDDISFRADYYNIDAHGAAMLGMMVRHTGTNLPSLQRAGHRAAFVLNASNSISELIHSHCASAAQLAARVGLDEQLPTILGQTFERWDGKGLPLGIAGAKIGLEMRIAQLADTAEVYLRTGGVAAAVDMAERRRGTQFDPAIVDIFCARAPELTAGLLEIDPWPATIALAPPDVSLDQEELDRVLAAIGEFADLKSPFTSGHSAAVAALAAEAGGRYGLDPSHVLILRRSGWVHDLGRMGVSNAIWDKAEPLNAMEREKLELYPFLGERILTRVPGMRRVALLVGSHRERMDGSGYPHGLGEPELDVSQRILAAADEYQGRLETRPHRPAVDAERAGVALHTQVAAGKLEARAVQAVLEAAANTKQRRHSFLPGGLTQREIEVLRLLCRGLNNKDIARELIIAPKTARNHIEHIYVKIGAGNRVAATLFAVENGLLEHS